MKILFFNWTTFGDRDIVDAFSLLKHEVVITNIEPRAEEKDDTFVLDCMQVISQHEIQLVFTSNFSPLVAEACHQRSVKYMAWVYDSPQKLLYSRTMHYDTNYVFLFDSHQYEELQAKGYKTVYYMPLATNAKRMDAIVGTDEDKARYACDVAFVGSLYNEEHNLYDRLKPRLSEYDVGYLEALMAAQKNVYGYYFLEDILKDSTLLDIMYQVMPYSEHGNNEMTREYCFANYFLGRKLANVERIEKLQKISEMCCVKIYTEGDTSDIPKACNMGSVNYYDEMPHAFHHAKINLNITLRTIRHGIPLRCLDIMGAGGFLLTNYQQDFLPLFEPNVDFVYYESESDMMDKIRYYLSHEEERLAIAKHGHDTVLKWHSYGMRLEEMLQIICDEGEVNDIF